MIDLYKGDCLFYMDLLPDKSVDCIITSPPYNIGKMHSNSTRHGTYNGNDMNENDYQDWQLRFMKECFRVLKEDGSFFYNHKVRIKNGAAIHPLQWIFKSDFILKQEITWDMGKSANSDKIRFFPYSERIYWLTKNPKVKLNNVDNLSDVWRVVPTHKRDDIGHIAKMPEQIAENIIRSNSYQIILDPFMGSGTTAKMAIANNRNWIGSEISEEYCQIIEQRIQLAAPLLSF